MNKDEEVKSAILEAAKRVFQKWGLNKTTMEDIAHEAGKGKSTLYYYFKSKDEIFELLVQVELSNIIHKAKSSTVDLISSKEKLKKYIETMLKEIKKSVSLYSLVSGEIKGNQEFIARTSKLLNDREKAIIIEILKEGHIAGEFNYIKDTEINKFASVIVGMISGLSIYLFFDNDDNEMIDIATRVIAEGF
ncbi:MAG: TetR/AcrR family transcriptional regulator [Bacteroidetes bacterium]|nr:TetR/AcrR family transcriptional regulator [Bacteroidota bacterium]MBU1116208.1 TetR/AcrR family transcriptional regulator [Bacteroidota bacterium]MBU1799882.1 TetR/AcrR family transcriptional regulator [Bacteroidota bacterium]